MKLIEHFVAGTTTHAAAEIVGVQANTAASFYMRFPIVEEQANPDNTAYPDTFKSYNAHLM